jgi:hypothetical protein
MNKIQHKTESVYIPGVCTQAQEEVAKNEPTTRSKKTANGPIDQTTEGTEDKLRR